MELKPPRVRRLRGEQTFTLVCPWCDHTDAVAVQVNVGNHQQSGGPMVTMWALAARPSRILASHDCPGPQE